MKDYTAVAGQLGVSHILALSQTKSNVVLKLGRHPDGPTLHFKIIKYSLARQVRALQKRPYESPGACKFIQYLKYFYLNRYKVLSLYDRTLMKSLTFNNIYSSYQILPLHWLY